MKKSACLRVSVVCFCIAGALGSGARAGMVIINDSFDNGSGDYFGTNVSSPDPFNFSYMDYYSESPDVTMLVDHVHDVERDDDGFPVASSPEMPEIQSLIRYQPTSYIPASSGAIGTLDFRIDYRTNDPFSDLSFVVQSSGGFGAIAGFTTPIADGNWHTLEVLGLNSEDYLNMDFEGSNALTFGFSFYSFATMDPGGIDPVIYQVEVDNFVVTVNPVPEPASMPLLLSGALPLAFRRRRSVR